MSTDSLPSSYKKSLHYEGVPVNIVYGIFAVAIAIHMQYINTERGQNAEILDVQAIGPTNNRCV